MTKTKSFLRLFSLLLLSILSIGLIACSNPDAEAAEAVDVLIEELPTEITLADKATLVEVREAYDALTAEQKELVTKLADLESAEETLTNLEKEKALQDAAKAVEDLIKGLPLIADLELENKAAVVAARTAYDALTTAQKALVTKLADLEALEAKIVELETAKADADAAQAVEAMIEALLEIEEFSLENEIEVEVAREAYDALTETQKALVTNLTDLEVKEQLVIDLTEALYVIERIDALPATIQIVTKVFVVGIRADYEKLTEVQKDLVTNLDKLEDAEATILALEKDRDDQEAALVVENIIEDLPLYYLLELEDEETVVAAREAYDALTEAQKVYVTNLNKLVEAENQIQTLIEEAQVAADKAVALEVTTQISRLPLLVEIADKPEIEAARAAYEELTEAQKLHVVNYNVLVEKEERVANLEIAKPVEDLIAVLPEVLTLDDEAEVVAAREAYDALAAVVQELVSNYAYLEAKELEIADLKDPDGALMRETLKLMPRAILDDVVLPDADGAITWAYKDGSDTSHFDLETGELLKLSLEQVKVTLIGTLNDTTVEHEVTFGMFAEGQIPIYYTGANIPAEGNTWDGFGTIETQKAVAGFGGFTITVGNKVYFVSNSYIPLEASEENEELSRETVRPFGLTAQTDYNNIGIKNGVAVGYSGAAALYHNVGEYTLTFNASDSYGRINVPTLGYGKVIFKLNDDGTYTVQQYLPQSSGDGNATGTVGDIMVVLEPGDMLWTPHTWEIDYHETGNSTGYGTKLNQAWGNGALEAGITIEVRKFNLDMFLAATEVEE